MILGICTGQVYITLNVFIIVLEACLKLRADLTNIPTSGRASQLSRAPKTVLLSKVTLTLGINNFLVVWIENLSNFKHFHISAMSNNRITADYEFFVNWQLSPQGFVLVCYRIIYTSYSFVISIINIYIDDGYNKRVRTPVVVTATCPRRREPLTIF